MKPRPSALILAGMAIVLGGCRLIDQISLGYNTSDYYEKRASDDPVPDTDPKPPAYTLEHLPTAETPPHFDQQHRPHAEWLAGQAERFHTCKGAVRHMKGADWWKEQAHRALLACTQRQCADEEDVNTTGDPYVKTPYERCYFIRCATEQQRYEAAIAQHLVGSRAAARNCND